MTYKLPLIPASIHRLQIGCPALDRRTHDHVTKRLNLSIVQQRPRLFVDEDARVFVTTLLWVRREVMLVQR